MLDPNAPYLLRVRVKDVPPRVAIPPGVEVLRRAGRGAKLYATRPSVRLVRDGTAQPVCKGCVPDDRPVLPVMTRGQLDELAALDARAERN